MPTAMKPQTDRRTLAYRYHGGLYINLTNKCPTACRFCIKFSWKMKYRDYDLRLSGKEPLVSEILETIDREYGARRVIAPGAARAEHDLARGARPFSEVVFCGYGESTYRLADMIAVCDAVKARYPKVRRRLNTIGLGNLINKRPISNEMAGHLDAVSISLNVPDAAQWVELMQPLPEFRERGFESVLEFIRECAAAIPDTTVTAVARPGVDMAECRRLAESLGARFRARPLLAEYEDASTR